MKNKAFLVLALLLVLILAGAGLLYNTLGSRVAPERQLVALADEAAEAPEEPEPQLPEEPAEEPTDGHEGEDHPAHAPDFTVFDRDGNGVLLSEQLGRPIVLNFWASWCGPCQSEMPDFHEKYLELGGDVAFMMVNMTDGQRETVESASDFVDSNGFTFPVYFDSTGEAAYNYGAYSLPTTYFIDAGGHVIAQATGAIDAETLQTGIDMIL